MVRRMRPPWDRTLAADEMKSLSAAYGTCSISSPHDESVKLGPCAGDRRQIPDRHRVVDTRRDEGGTRCQYFESLDVR